MTFISNPQYDTYITYYVPNTKKELVNWLYNHKIGTVTELNKMGMKQLLAIYHNRRKVGR